MFMIQYKGIWGNKKQDVLFLLKKAAIKLPDWCYRGEGGPWLGNGEVSRKNELQRADSNLKCEASG